MQFNEVEMLRADAGFCVRLARSNLAGARYIEGASHPLDGLRINRHPLVEPMTTREIRAAQDHGRRARTRYAGLQAPQRI
ncbi:hypothetical protein D9M72_577180 [compost metagenome]